MTGMFFIKGYAQRTEVLTLGVFHFDFPNLDMQPQFRNIEISEKETESLFFFVHFSGIR